MHCQSCGSPLPDGATSCPVCQAAVVPGAPAVATGALTPPDGLAPAPAPPDQIEQLAQRLQAALGEGYKVEKALGSGGFAVVFLARDLNLKRKLAVKVLSPDLITSRTVLERFRREAETVAQLSHPHIVPLHFIGQKEDLVYLAMECVAGGSLADRIEKEGKLPVDEVARIMREVASALDHAHRRGVVHRDIKPHNVLMEEETGRSLVTDFGIALTAGAASLTASGMLVGTPAYLSPEQVTGGHGDHRSDLYALGVMGYEMLTGQPPFSGPTPTAVLMHRLSQAPTPVEKLRPDVPRALREVIEGCLLQDPLERFQSGAEIVRALGGQTPVSGGHPTAELLRRRRRRHITPFGAGASAVALLTVIGLAGGLLIVRRGPHVSASRTDPGMVLIASGAYPIGRNEGAAIARPRHVVRLDSFAIDAGEVSVGSYKAFVDSTRAPAPWRVEPDPRLPVTGVTWPEAAAYCAWRHGGGRLPTEEEWEAAARGQAGRRFPWGEAWNPAAANTRSAGRSGPAPAGSFPVGASPEGVYDLIGNVWEWTASRLANYPGGAGAPENASEFYVIRGGAFDTPDSLAVATLRGWNRPTAARSELDKTGFRCAMPLKPSGGRR